MKIVDFDRSHILEIVALQEDCFTDGWSAQMHLSAFDGGRYFGYCALDGERVIGYVACSLGVDDCDLEAVAVTPDYRRQGVANALIERVIDRVKKAGLDGIFLEVRESNAPAIALYGRWGFDKISVRKKYYPDGENAVVMKRSGL